MPRAEIVAKSMTFSAAWRALRCGLSLRGLSLQTVSYALLAFAASLWVTSEFFASLKAQLFLAQARSGAIGNEQVWSAPLDDVFIHFDFARSAARGLPLQWSDGNGYSSGGTSLLYPFVLAVGYLLGYRDGQLMLWAGIVACLSIWSLLMSARHLSGQLPPWVSFVLPPAFVCIGCLSWTLTSGMEVAFFLAVWGICFMAWEKFHRDLVAMGPASVLRSSVLLGAANLVLVATRPEAAVVVAILSISAALSAARSGTPFTRLIALLVLSAMPAALVVVAQTIANYWLTGESAAAGALVKLEMHHPYLASDEVRDAWWHYLKYQVLRVTNYHFSDVKYDAFDLKLSSGWLMWILALVPLASRKTRSSSLLLWACVISWLCIVAFNGQVRWQNERYTMPAVAWLLLNASLGVALLLSLAHFNLRKLWSTRFGLLRLGGASLGVLASVVVVLHQAPRFRGQLWFFGRASRNIYEQHIEVAKRLASTTPPPRRVLVGDAGAIPYFSDLPALDLIGLGGYHQLPFARATRQGVAAAIELIQRLPPEDLPDRMAIYPGWWGDLPSWFGKPQFGVSVRGNVICGGPEKVVYKLDWSVLNRQPVLPPATGHRVVAEVDVADLVSEKASHWTLLGSPGYVTMKRLPHPITGNTDLWDAGRLMLTGSQATFRLKRNELPATVAAPASKPSARAPSVSELLLLTAPSEAVELELRSADGAPASLSLEAGDRWQLTSLPVSGGDHIQLLVTTGELVLYHLWGLSAP